ncbi:thiol:disulfide interchange protein precursor [bacteria symbiont BFo1 of Frankliniella occidentalis]|uniref:Thiol:disulfide interchange protein DsbD n=1 Tax=Erwinia aphidicola TaxID=68334 RepID=A0ABU8DB95_ERWAP|nr:protein-disulfide reductase DsbD [Erwinia aphidicola]KMV68755.1 thiol:disulfide interchange protein precursor [bacteria symbiont BFo1 of Frankliniella occidentalis]KYP86003.1 thiol:disulfide interchange protein precursor [bacteria symbiont BFo1 of Frankliniella occidentalis]KYP88267.1 thiol:disulfide interchange protein precursor [bacteria symbiont BFo1 of Frankliniella occidentalis]
MTQRLIPYIFLLLLSLFSATASASLFGQNSNSQFVPVNQAFAFDFSQKNDQLTLSWQVKPGYYLYRQQLKISVQGATLAQWELPAGKPHQDEFYGKTEIYPQSLTLPFTLEQAGNGAQMTVTYQGCAAAGFCYPPETRSVPLNAVAAHSSAPAPAPSAAVSAAPDNRSDNALPFSPLWALLIGIGVAFTPCVLPMYPLISGIILGGNRQYRLGRLFALAMVYVQGMALTYTVMGIVVAAAGLRFQAALQAPAVLIVLSALFIVLALSMFGLFSLQLPSSLQTRLTLWSNRQQGGSLPGVFLMGALAGLICSPCTTAPLSAILLYIAQSGNMLAGGGTLYLYALGMGLPLIAITLFGNRLLPKSGPWMQTVKEGFGFVILALPVFLLERVIGDAWGLRLWSALGVAFFGWAFISSLKADRGWLRVLQILLLGAMLIAARPLQDWAFGNAPTAESAAHLSFNRVSSVKQLNQQLQNSAGKITMLDLYADWCVACKEFEKYTFSDGQVQSALGQLQLLQADVTANSATDSALLQHLNVLGLPTILFFDASGHEIPGSRITGLMKPAAFRAHLQKLAR